MDAAIKQKWIKALRSGRYEQGRNHLKLRNKYCCLGVLCAVTQNQMSYGKLYDFLDGDAQKRLMIMNDEKRRSFPEIADYIERNL